MPDRKTLRERVLSRCMIQPDGCWLWAGAHNNAGRAQVGSGPPARKTVYVHHVTYELWWGPVPQDRHMRRTCESVRCVNPAHWEPGTLKPTANVKCRILDRVVVNSDGCWVWQGAISENGYGAIAVGDGSTGYTHRLSYEAWIGSIPLDREIDHLCRNKACCNPSHLEAVDRMENIKRAFQAAGLYDTCGRGHLMAGDNLREYVSSTGRHRRYCRECSRERARERRGG